MRSLTLSVFLVACAAPPPPQPEPVVAEGPPPICSVESPDLCLQDGIDLEAGVRGEPDLARARTKYELACEGGVARACTRLGALLANSDDQFDRARVLGLWQGACEAEEPMACAQLGAHLLANGFHQKEGPARDEKFEAANTLLTAVCDAPELDETHEHWGMTVRGYACSTLAAAHESGLGVEADLGRALELQTEACRLGWKPACEAATQLGSGSSEN